MPAIKPVVRDPDSKKRQILKAARRLMLDRALHEIVLDDVAKEAGVAKGTLFLYYRSKDELFSAAFLELVENLGHELEALGRLGLRGRELLVAAARVILGHFDHNRDFIAQFSSGAVPACGAKGGERLRDTLRGNLAQVRALIAAAAKDGGRSIADLDYASAAFVGLCRSATVRKLIERHDRPLDREADRVADFFANGSGVSL